MERGWPKWRLEEVNRRRRTRARETNGTHDRRLPFPINPYALLVKFIARLISGQITRLTRTTRRADSLSCQGRAPAEKASTRYTRRGTVARDRKNGRPPAVVGRKKYRGTTNWRTEFHWELFNRITMDSCNIRAVRRSTVLSDRAVTDEGMITLSLNV